MAASSTSARSRNSGSVDGLHIFTTVRPPAGSLAKVASLPPNPKQAPAGRFSHPGAWPAETPSPVSVREYTLTVPSNEEVDRIAGSFGDQRTSKFQFPPAGSSHMMVPILGFQQIVRLSFAHVRSIELSCGLHDSPRMPRECPRSVFAGECALRRSHIWRMGVVSSSEATMTWVATSGFHARQDREVRVAESVKLMTGLFCRRSQTTEVPLLPVEARMCSTLGFHATHVMSIVGCVAWPGV
mmetsp:Transcript_41681/g.87041  ORF Transcript_41681/g.87041 Transcript_41681/m.87041 type:complete len:241 (+) Transcript_41681:2669-3391(+)